MTQREPLTREELAEIRQLLSSPLAPGLSPSKLLDVVDSAIHYEDLAARYLAHRANNRRAQKRHREGGRS